MLTKARLGFDYLRYLNPIYPPYPPTSFLPGRAKSRAPAGIARHRRWKHLLLSERESAHAAEIEAKRRLRREEERLARTRPESPGR